MFGRKCTSEKAVLGHLTITKAGLGSRRNLGAGKILKDNSKDKDSNGTIKPLPCRFHDLRHTAVSRMLNTGVPIAKVAKIVGWNTATMVRMAARYGHFTLDELRGARRA